MYSRSRTMNQLLSLLDLERLENPGANEVECVRRIAHGVIRDLGITEPPVDVRMVASFLDIGRVRLDHSLDAAGCLICGPTGAEIRVRASDGRGRRRFTICHECVHTFFPGYSHQTQYRCSPGVKLGQDRSLEALCDIGASELLLPRGLVSQRSLQAPFALDTIEYLASAFEASLVAAGGRFVDVWPEPAALLIFEDRNKPSEAGSQAPRQFRLQAAFHSGDWPFFKRHKSVHQGDVFDRAAQGEIIRGEWTMIAGLATSRLSVEVHAQLYPYWEGDVLQRRVLALLRRTETTR